MIQFLKYDAEKVERTEFSLISGSELYKYFAKKLGYLLLLIYSTLFLAVAIPFHWTYFIGGMVIMIFLMRIGNNIIKCFKYNNGKLTVDKGAIEISADGLNVKIPADAVTYVELNVFGNLVIRQKYDQESFPIALLREDDRGRLFDLFRDMAPKRTRFFRKTWELCDAIFVAFILAMHIRQFIVQAYFIPTGSMENTLQVGDHLLVEKITYGPIVPRMLGMDGEVRLWGMREPQRGDIIIFSNKFFKAQHEEERDFIKRCIAVAGDNFHINEEDGFIYINGKKVDEPYIKDYSRLKDMGITDYRGFGSKKIIEGKVETGYVIALGDNRTNSQDSRYFGYVPVSEIKGRAFILYWNTDQIFNKAKSQESKDVFLQRLGLIR
jgi:signal peptidase I